MSLRTIMIFPKFKDMDIIEDIRDRFDPLAKLVRPHITLVFPFEHDMSNEELTKILDNRLSEITPFDLEMHGFNKQAEEFGNYHFLKYFFHTIPPVMCSIQLVFYHDYRFLIRSYHLNRDRIHLT